MKRRLWPAALVALSILVFGSYLAYTQYLVQQIRREAAIHARIFSIVQQAVIHWAEAGDDAIQSGWALWDLQAELQALQVPIVVINASGEPLATGNLPFEQDLVTEDGRLRIKRFASELQAKRPGNAIVRHGLMEIYFGDPPVLARLLWVPYLQVGAGLLLILVTFGIMRADMRAHRERMYAAMARELAHQMGTPLSSLAGWIEVLQLPEQERAALAPAEKIANVMQADIERLERVSRRFELIGTPPVLEPASVRDMITELTGYFAPRLPHLGNGIRLRARCEPRLPAIRANSVLLVWALENIVKNAIDALAGRGGRITILGVRDEPRDGATSHGVAPGVRILIADDGPGIASGVRDRIFEPGFSTKSAGWGVGLSLSRRIVEELHHGRINVRNRASGGAIFEIRLPIAKS